MMNVGQPYLPGLAPGHVVHYLFFALMPQTDDAARIIFERRRLQRRYDLAGRLIASDRLHISLHCVGAYDCIRPDTISRARAAVEDIVSPPIDIVFDHAMTFKAKAKQALVLLPQHSSCLIAFYGCLAKAIRRAGIRRPEQNFTPHMTLLYGQGTVPKAPIETLRWRADRVFLICSHRGRGIYEKFGERLLCA